MFGCTQDTKILQKGAFTVDNHPVGNLLKLLDSRFTTEWTPTDFLMNRDHGIFYILHYKWLG